MTKAQKFDGEPSETSSAWRTEGAPAFIQCVLNKELGEIDFMFKDSKGATFNPAYATLRQGWTMVDAKAEAIRKHDEEAWKRTHNFNCRLYKTKGCRRLQEFAASGDRNQVAPAFSKLLDAADPPFDKVVLPGPLVA